MAKKIQHGGEREGAGRPPVHPEGATTRITVTVPELIVDRLGGIAEANGWSQSEAVTRAIRAFIAKPKRG